MNLKMLELILLLGNERIGKQTGELYPGICIPCSKQQGARFTKLSFE